MRAELEKKLESEFPFMKKGETLEKQKTDGCVHDLYSAFGIECLDGWYDLIHDLCSEIMDAYKEAGRPMDLVPDQVKEKFGTLRFYYHFEGRPAGFHGIDLIRNDGSGINSIRVTPQADDFEKKISDIVRKYEDKSGTVCEECGSSGTLRSDTPWIMTLCNPCYERMTEGKK